MNNNFQLILDDLNQNEPSYVSIVPPFYDQDATPIRKIYALNRQLRRARSLNNRIEMINTAWYIGQVLETTTESSAQRTECMNHLSAYYRKVAIKVYYLYEMIGNEQIARSKHVTLAMIFSLSKKNHLRLVEEAATIAGARL